MEIPAVVRKTFDTFPIWQLEAVAPGELRESPTKGTVLHVYALDVSEGCTISPDPECLFAQGLGALYKDETSRFSIEPVSAKMSPLGRLPYMTYTKDSKRLVCKTTAEISAYFEQFDLAGEFEATKLERNYVDRVLGDAWALTVLASDSKALRHKLYLFEQDLPTIVKHMLDSETKTALEARVRPRYPDWQSGDHALDRSLDRVQELCETYEPRVGKGFLGGSTLSSRRTSHTVGPLDVQLFAHVSLIVRYLEGTRLEKVLDQFPNLIGHASRVGHLLLSTTGQ